MTKPAWEACTGLRRKVVPFSSMFRLLEPSDEIVPQLHVYDAFHAESELIPVSRLNGITNAIVAPENTNTLPGQDAFIQLGGRSADDMLLVRDMALPLNFTGDQRRNQSWDKRKFPFTRMGMAAQIRQALLDAQHYREEWAAYEKKKTNPTGDKDKTPTQPKRDLKLRRCFLISRARKRLCWQQSRPAIWKRL
jgi:hypothetical protein